MIKVLVVDDQALVRAGFTAIIGADPDLHVVGEAADGAEALTVAAANPPDVVVMDIRMPNMDGITATQHLMARQPRPAVLVLTTFDLDEYVYTALRAGASGFLLKDTPPAELLRAIKIVAVGDALLSPSITRKLIEDYTRRPAAASSPHVDVKFLTDREVDVLVEIALGLSNQEIAEKLYVGESTVKTHIGRILAKLNLTSRAQAVAFAYESGLVIPGAGPAGRSR